MFQTLVDCGLVMEKYIKENISSEDPVNIKQILGNFSTDIIGSCAFGIECNSFKQPDSPFREYSKKAFTRGRFSSFKAAFASSHPNLSRALGIRLTDPDVTNFFTNVVRDTINYRLENNYQRKDLLQLLIDMRNEKEDRKTRDGNSLTLNEIVAQCFLFFIAGFETSSTTMTFALFELAKHQDLQEKAREELVTILAKHDNQVTYDSLSELKYMKQVIDETLRMYPPVPVLPRMCVKDFKVPGEDVVLEKGTRVVCDPPRRSLLQKPEVFDPERFSDENRKNIPQFAHLPFGDGPRNCIGERFGIMQTKVGLACILKNFRVTLNEKTQFPIKMDPAKFIPEVLGGVWLNLEKL
ncbi:hypothetical protein NQ318_005489 [Aromia moschata]|uniref:Cytochrome P450 n=1 Tax=Aromia moschata TaxID=1265417 RepID=A0AAV8XQ74_9CUCU|nr:hypothetical protein NQ318_005489 [Aromia moschata]